jgi:hypothetical protein
MMSPEEAGNYLAAVLSTAVTGVAIPLGILLSLLQGIRKMIEQATLHPDGFLAKMLSDGEGKPSSDRIVKLVAVAVTLWMGMVVVFSQPQLILQTMGLIMIGWGGIDLTKYWLGSRVDLATAKSPSTEAKG